MNTQSGGVLKMGNNWCEITLNEICLLVVDCPHSTPTWTNSGFIVLRNQYIKNGWLDLSEPSFTDSYHFAQRIRRAKPTFGDIVITREAPMGDVCMIPKGIECCLGQRQVLLRPNPKIVDPRFLLYALQSHHVQQQIGWNEGTGSTVSNLRIPVLKALRLSTPPLPDQHTIAHILGTLDDKDKIELNRRMNQTLENMAQALFKSWFVDFDGVAEKDMQESELGLIPRGWKCQSADSFTKIGIGKTPPRKELQWFSDKKEDWRWASIRDMAGGDVFQQLTSEYLTDDAVSRFRIRIVPDGAVLLSFKLTMGRVAIADGELTTNEAIAHFVLSEKPVISSEYLYLYLRNFDYSSLGSTSSIATAVNSKIICGMPIIIPSAEISSRFTKTVSPIFEKIRRNQTEINTLTSLRDTLLPQLMSGKLRVQGLVAG